MTASDIQLSDHERMLLRAFPPSCLRTLPSMGLKRASEAQEFRFVCIIPARPKGMAQSPSLWLIHEDRDRALECARRAWEQAEAGKNTPT